jgi:hypothetical protein
MHPFFQPGFQTARVFFQGNGGGYAAMVETIARRKRFYELLYSFHEGSSSRSWSCKWSLWKKRCAMGAMSMPMVDIKATPLNKAYAEAKTFGPIGQLNVCIYHWPHPAEYHGCIQ